MSGVLTQVERDAVSALGEIAGRMREIMGGNRADMNEAIIHVHALQQMVMSNAAARAYPGEYRLLGMTMEETLIHLGMNPSDDETGEPVVSRHLVAIPGGAHSLPHGVVRPLRSHVSARDQARAAGHPSVFDREANPDRPVLPLDVQVALSALDGLAHMVTRVAQKYGPNVPTAEWHRIRAQVGALTEARATVARWVDGDLTNAEGTVRP